MFTCGSEECQQLRGNKAANENKTESQQGAKNQKASGEESEDMNIKQNFEK